jgi:rhodanese-related sulfurtransferase
MSNPYGVAELSVQEVEKKRQAGESFVWLDVREPNELQAAYIDDERVVELPMSRLSAYQQCPSRSLAEATRLDECLQHDGGHRRLGRRD